MKRLNQLFLVLFLFCSPVAATYAACCHGHKGVASCNAQGQKVCGDKTISPTCKCEVTKSATTQTSTTTTPASTTAKNKVKHKGTKGCCSRHKGLAHSCQGGYQVCNDKTISATCACN